jgi:hypothetical protein
MRHLFIFTTEITSIFITAILAACTPRQAYYNDNSNVITVTNSQAQLADQVFPSSVVSQIPSAPITPPPITGTPISIDLNAEKLPRGFRGDSGMLPKIFYRFSKISKKDEYESKIDYTNRLKRELDDSIYTFAIDQSKVNFLNTVEYNADSQILSVRVGMFTSKPTSALLDLDLETISSAKSYKRIQISSKYTSLNDYIGSNAFGHKVLVSKASFDNYGLAVANQIKTDVLGTTITAKLSPGEARSLGKNVGIALICKLHTPEWSEPLAYDDYTHSKPTIDSPTDVLSVDHLVVIDLYQIWIYDRDTGQIIKKEMVNK